MDSSFLSNWLSDVSVTSQKNKAAIHSMDSSFLSNWLSDVSVTSQK